MEGRAGDHTGSVMVVTGANSGIGLEAAVALAGTGATVVLACRNPRRGGEAVQEVKRRSGSSSVELVGLDLASLASVRDCASEILERWDRLDVLALNAGGFLTENLTTVDGFEMTFGVNHLGHMLLTQLLTDRLVESAPARVVVTASLAHRMAPTGMTWSQLEERRRYLSWQVYGESKLANILFTVELAERLAGTGVTANCFHPGLVRTGFGSAEDTGGIDRLLMALGRPILVTAARGAEPLVRLATSPDLEGVTGGYFAGGYLPGVRRGKASRKARDRAAARRLWEVSEAMIEQVG